MKQKYRIKSEYKHLVSEDCQNREFTRGSTGGYRYTIASHCKGEKYEWFKLSDEMFEPIEEERIELFITNGYLAKYENGETSPLKWTEGQRMICEKALNGELIERQWSTLEVKGEKVKTTTHNNTQEMTEDLEYIIENGTKKYTQRQMIELVNEWMEGIQSCMSQMPHKTRVASFKDFLNNISKKIVYY